MHIERLTSDMIVLYRIMVNNSNRSNYLNSRHNKGDIINVTKVVVKKSILMQTTKARATNRYH
ncbi:MAG: hypothetical protein ACJ71K_10775 [Nitrososphaeraceae archaeon]|jgi:hypothetical protein